WRDALEMVGHRQLPRYVLVPSLDAECGAEYRAGKRELIDRGNALYTGQCCSACDHLVEERRRACFIRVPCRRWTDARSNEMRRAKAGRYVPKLAKGTNEKRRRD